MGSNMQTGQCARISRPATEAACFGFIMVSLREAFCGGKCEAGGVTLWTPMGSVPCRSNSGVRMGLPTLSVCMLTRLPSFSNWSIDSWRTRPRSEPEYTQPY